MKVVLRFDLNKEEDKEEYKSAMQGSRAKMALWNIAQYIFRPARKHGYNNPELQKLMEKNPGSTEIVVALERMFYNILKKYDVEIE